MKNFYFVLCLIILAAPVWADDDLKPEPLDQAIKEYNGFWQTDNPDPMNHEIWRLYIYYALTPRDGYSNGRTPEWLVAGLTPNPKDHYFIELRINQLYNFLRPIPQRGDVIVVEGRILNHLRSNITTPNRNFILKNLFMNVENAVSLPKEHIDIPIPSPVTPSAAATSPPVMTPTIGVIPAASPQGVITK